MERMRKPYSDTGWIGPSPNLLVRTVHTSPATRLRFELYDTGGPVYFRLDYESIHVGPHRIDRPFETMTEAATFAEDYIDDVLGNWRNK